MRTINGNLTAEQKKATAQHTATVDINGTDHTGRLVGFTYRSAAMAPTYADVYLDNTDQGLTGAPPTRGHYVDLARGCVVDGTAYTAELPRRWIEEVRLVPGYVVLRCIDMWGKLGRWRCSSTETWSATDAGTIIGWILAEVGITDHGTWTALAIDFTIPRGESGDAAIKRVCAKVAQYPYETLNGTSDCKTTPASEAIAYTFGWSAEAVGSTVHPVLEASYTQGLARFNKVTVDGALYGAARYTGSATDSAQTALAGNREKYIVDNALTSNTLCAARAAAELAYYTELANAADIACLPVHGLEIYDVIQLDTTPWGGTDYTARVGRYTEYYWAGKVRQEITLAHAQHIDRGPVEGSYEIASPEPLPAFTHGCTTSDLATLPGDVSDAYIQPANLPEATVVTGTEQIIAPESLGALQVVGTHPKDTSSYTYYLVASDVANGFYATAGRSFRAGDGLVSYDTVASEYRLYVMWSNSRILYFVPDGSLTS